MGEELQFCSNCKKNVSRTNFTVHNVHCQRNIIECSLCHDSVPKSHYQQHVEALHSSIQCQACGADVEAVNLFYHQTELCPKRLIACHFCDLEVTWRELEKHTEFCGARTDRCKGCTKYVQFKHLQFHYEHDHKYLNPAEKEEAEENGVEGDEGEECPICLGPVTLPLSLECGHVFCMVCVRGIANTTKNCAICRRDIQRDMLMDIRFCREEDVIKNYVNNPKYKKTSRSKSVPSRRVGITTEDYDNMVSALLSTRTSSSNYRYQRPNNGHTPSPYTPYCYATAGTTSSTTSTQSSMNTKSNSTSSDSYKDDECCCSSSKSSTPSTSTTTPCTTSKSDAQKRPNLPTSKSTTCYSSSVSSTRSSSVAPSSKPCTSSASSKVSKSVTSGSKTTASSEERPRRPTSLALQTDDKAKHPSRKSEEKTQPQHLSQEEYDRWLAFQLAQAEDEMSASEFNKAPRSPFRRSRSMPERKDESKNIANNEQEKSFPPSLNRCEYSNNESQSRLPPTSPRCNSAVPSTVGNSANTSYARGSNLTKSSSDSSANGNTSSSNSNSAISTGARPKSSTGLKKRVSFKEDAPSIRRQEQVLLPCEFCDEVFPERDLMRHQTSCDKNETKNPREYLLSRRSSKTSPITSPTSPTPNALESPSRSNSQIRSLRTPPHSPSLHSRLNQSPISPPLSPSSSTSPQLTNTLSEGYYSPFESRHASISPGPGTSVSSGSDVSSGISSINSSSVSTTPSTSSSASPVPAVTRGSTPGTPTDVEVDFEEEESAFVRPRKGKLISSAISSWRSISGSKPKDHQKYARSNTAPLEVTADDDLQSSDITTSHSAAYIRAPLLPEDIEEDSQDAQESSQGTTHPVFIRNKNKYPAPAPPQSTNTENSRANVTEIASNHRVNSVSSKSIGTIKERKQSKYAANNQESNKTSVFKFDSITVMNGKPNQKEAVNVIPCEFCKQVFSPEKFRTHQTVCSAEKESESPANHSRKSELQKESKEAKSSTPTKRNKGPAPQPPSETEIPIRRRPIERSLSVRESTSETRQSKEFQPSGRRLERACSIKETSRFTSRPSCDSPPRKWLSREGFYGSSLDCSAAYSAGGSLTSSNTSLNSYTNGHGWSSHINMIRDDARSRRASYIYAGTTSPTTPFYGASRYRDRSSSRHRPSSLYSSRHAFTIIADAFAAATERGRNLR